jgi:hypothetical protein
VNAVAASASDGASPAPARKRYGKQELAVTTCPRLAASEGEAFKGAQHCYVDFSED